MLRIKFSAGRQFSASKSASSPSAKTLAEILKTNYVKIQLSIFLFLNIFILTKSQNKRFLYEYKYVPDSTKNENIETEIMALDIYKGFSKFYSYEKFKSDSLQKAIADKSISATGMIETSRTENSRGKINYIISKKYPDYETNYLTRLGQTKYIVKEERKLHWKILENKEKLDKYVVQKATTEFAGRKWIAFFTTEIPLQDGPYKFQGLPGLILKISDVNNNHSFSLVGIQNISNIEKTKEIDFVFEFGNSQNISNKQYRKIFKEYRKDPNKSIRQTLKDLDEINENGKMIDKNEYLRVREKRILEQNKRNNNILEIDLLYP